MAGVPSVMAGQIARRTDYAPKMNKKKAEKFT
jgi:hypothetical protein